MKPLSIEDAYLWAQRFVAREWRLILPVAFTFIAFPPLVLDLLVPQWQANVLAAAAQPANPALMMGVMRWLIPVMLVLFLLSNIGGLAVTALALVPGISVREAMTLALRRLGVLVGSQLLLFAGAVGVMIALGLATAFARLASAGAESLVGGVVIGIGLFVGIRLITLMPMIVRRRVGSLSALRESWLATGGVFWRVLAAVVIYLLGAIVVMVALSTSVGTMLVLLGKMIGAPELGTALDAVVRRGLAALAGVGLQLIAVGIFRQLDGSIKGH